MTYAFIPLVVLLAFGLGWREWREFIELQDLQAELMIGYHEPVKQRKTLLRRLEKANGEKFNELFKQAEKQYPDNAFIDMLWIENHLEQYADTEKYTIADKKQFELIIERLKLLNTRSTYDSQRSKETQLELDAIQAEYRPGFNRNIKQLSICSSVILPEVRSQRLLSEIICNKASEELKDGDTESAEKLLLLFSNFLYQLCNSKEYSFLQELVTIACAGNVIKNENLQELLKTVLPYKIHTRACSPSVNLGINFKMVTLKLIN